MLLKNLLLNSIIILCFFSSVVKADNSSDLSNTGTFIYFDPSNERTHHPQNVFDDNLNTYFQAHNPSQEKWVGRDFGKKYVITKIAFAPRMDEAKYEERPQLGIFEGANNPDFGDAIALYIIPDKIGRNMNEITINCTRGFRYFRYVFPVNHQGISSYISEIKIYGYESDGDNTKLPQLTNLPTINIHTVNNKIIDSKENYVKGIISIVYDNGTKVQTDSVEIRGRGNNSWTHPKKPYRIKLANSTRLMNLPAKARNWTLINNYGDKTLMRNILAFDFSKKLDMPYTSPAEAVDVIINGEYKGCYQLCDHIDVRKKRVDIEEMTATNTTGGYMVEIDAYADSEPLHFYTSHFNMPVTIKYPDSDDITQEQLNFITNHFNNLTKATNSSQYNDPYNGFRKYMDTKTFLKYFLIGEYTGNTDTYWSVRMYKFRNDEKFYFGPVWDFDLSFDNDDRTYPVNSKTSDWLSLSYLSSSANGCKNFIQKIFSDPTITEELKYIYSFYRDRDIISKEKLINVADSCTQLLMQSQELNFKRWPIMNEKVHQNPYPLPGSYAAEVTKIREYISTRIDFIDNKLNYVPGTTISNNEFDHPVLKVWSGQGIIHFANISEPCNYILTDISGKIITTGKISNNMSIKINKGVYIVRISNLTTEQIIKCMVN